MKVSTTKKLFILGAFFWLLPSIGEAATRTVDCSVPGKTLQGAINKLKPGNTLQVINGSTCSENVVIREDKERITVDGLGTATVNGPDTTSSVINVRGRAVTIKGFTITGGETGILVNRGGTTTIDGNTIQNVGGTGISVTQHSFARIINNTIQNNSNGNGISVSETSSARIGFLSSDDTTAQPNTIQNNRDGIRVTRSSNARIVGNTIKNNTDDGVDVERVSHADISKNTIDNNGGDGIELSENSGVNLGTDSGTGIFNAPNDTTVGQENGGFGIRCFTNSYANGRLGTLNGDSGAKGGNADGTAFSSSCVDSLI